MVNGRDDGAKLNGVDMSNPPDQKDQNTVTRTKQDTQSETGSTTNDCDPQIFMGTHKTIRNRKHPIRYRQYNQLRRPLDPHGNTKNNTKHKKTQSDTGSTTN